MDLVSFDRESHFEQFAGQFQLTMDFLRIKRERFWLGAHGDGFSD